MSEPTEKVRTTAIIGFLIAGAVLVAVSIFAQGQRSQPDVALPEIAIAGDSIVDGSSTGVRFTSTSPLVFTPMGWMADDLHLHVIIDTTMLMPGPADLQHIAADTFLWTLPMLAPGPHDLRFFWADPRHAPIGDSVPHRIIVPR